MPPLEFLVVGLYLAALLYLGLKNSSRSSGNSRDFILAGRRLSLPGFVATLVATWYGGILGVGENTYLYGIQTWFIFGLPYYVFGLLFALFIARRIQAADHVSIPDHIHHHFGRKAGLISAFYILFMASPAPYILSIGILLQFTLQIPLGPALLLSAGFSLFYVWFGGFKAVVRTDIMQFILMFCGFILLFAFSWIKAGPPTVIFSQLPDMHLVPGGGLPLQYILVWFFIALWTFVDPGFFQRCAAAKDGDTAKKGILISLGFWFVFDLLTLFTGLYAKVLLSPGPALFTFPRLGAEVLPPLVYGIFLTGLLAAIMSTIDSLGFISAITFGRDILWRVKSLKNPKITDWGNQSIGYIRTGLVVMALIALVLAYSLPSVIKLWYTLGSILIPGLLLPFLLTFTKKSIAPEKISALLIWPPIIAAGWFAAAQLTGFNFLGVEPFYPGMLTSILILLLL
ncbi:MAG: sodium:solute symporter family protein [Candidatus Neomarinimicrobiota bacterium]